MTQQRLRKSKSSSEQDEHDDEEEEPIFEEKDLGYVNGVVKFKNISVRNLKKMNVFGKSDPFITFKAVMQFKKYSLNGDTIIWDRSLFDDGFLDVDIDDNVKPWGGDATSTNLSVFQSNIKCSQDVAVKTITNYLTQETTFPWLFDYHHNLFYEFEYAALLAYYDLNIRPSNYHLLNCHPTQYKEITINTPDPIASDIPIGCQLQYDRKRKKLGQSRIRNYTNIMLYLFVIAQ
ncbi:MAG: hypothetical protein EZS28_051391 [Streblomastix strix]|uniref:C2 domain-containing protein n=1 Tax=Streblomastix strix TaxID=222440 RepID=A0A5J4T513_9EUKA|nr:MAG: hypothetical protein EZS28_051391 [Streblomastix strix]